jgi:cell division protein FtsZ
MGMALMGTGRASGPRRAVEAMQAAISSPLLEDVTLDGATGLLVNITGGAGLTLHEVDEAVSMAHQAADADANIIFGSVIDERLGDEVKITVIATGFAPPGAERRPAPRAVAAQAPAAVAPRAVPPPLPAQPKAAEPAPIRLAKPVAAAAPAAAPVTATVRAGAGRVPAGAFTPEQEDQYDIPAFLRRGGPRQDG